MTEGSTDRVLEMINAAQSHLATFARESYAHYGRGVIRVAFPAVPPGTQAIVSAEMVYHDLEEMKTLVGDTAEGSITLRLIESYEPEGQAVVIATIGTGNPITMTLRLAPPAFVNGPSTLQ